MRKKMLFVFLMILMGTYKDEVKATNEGSFVTVATSEMQPSPPYFVKKLKDLSVSVGSEVRLSAEVTGNPMPSFTCLKDGVPITSEGRYKITEEFGKITIMIRDVRMEDAGRYGIQATNRLGIALTECDLTVTEE